MNPQVTHLKFASGMRILKRNVTVVRVPKNRPDIENSAPVEPAVAKNPLTKNEQLHKETGILAVFFLSVLRKLPKLD